MMDSQKLNKILIKHKEWLKGVGGSRAVLRNADLRNADLCINLRWAAGEH